jgi:hypothetical protein
MLVDMVCERETSQVFVKFRTLATDIAQAVIKDKDEEFRSKSSVELSLSLIAALVDE